MTDTLTKQPAESRLFDMDFSPRLSDGELISSVISVTERTVDQNDGSKAASSDLTIGLPTFNQQIAQARISGGLDATLYEITFLVNTDLGNTVEAEGLLWVSDTI